MRSGVVEWFKIIFSYAATHFTKQTSRRIASPTCNAATVASLMNNRVFYFCFESRAPRVQLVYPVAGQAFDYFFSTALFRQNGALRNGSSNFRAFQVSL